MLSRVGRLAVVQDETRRLETPGTTVWKVSPAGGLVTRPLEGVAASACESARILLN